jgi:hypothetical protein
VQRIRIHRPRVRRERPWHEALPSDPRDPDVVRAKALARAVIAPAEAQPGSHVPPGPPVRRADGTHGSPGERPTSMYSYLLPEFARQRGEDLRRAALHCSPAEPRSRRPVTAVRTTRPGGGRMRSNPRILVALLLAALR